MTKCKRPSRKQIRRSRRALLARDGNRCWICSKELKISHDQTIDHVLQLKYGGTNDLNNLKLACRWCNESREWTVKTALKMVSLTPEKRRKIFG